MNFTFVFHWCQYDLLSLTEKKKLRCTLLNVNKLELLTCLTENCELNFLGGGTSASFPFVLGSQTGIPKDLKNRKFCRKGELTILEFGGHWN